MFGSSLYSPVSFRLFKRKSKAEKKLSAAEIRRKKIDTFNNKKEEPAPEPVPEKAPSPEPILEEDETDEDKVASPSDVDKHGDMDESEGAETEAETVEGAETATATKKDEELCGMCGCFN